MANEGKRRILLQLDTDTHASVFDSVVATDAGAEVLLRHGNVEPTDVRDLVYGLMFTRGGADLASSAVFVGGGDIDAADAVMQQVLDTFFGPVRVSVMADPSGANTTAAAAVGLAGKHLNLADAKLAVLGSTGPVGRRVVRLLAKCRTETLAVSRSIDRAQQVVDKTIAATSFDRLTAMEASSPGELTRLLDDVDGVISAGAPGVCLLRRTAWESTALKLLIDLNAVPPLGIEGVEAQDRAAERGSTIAYGALGVGRTKMKIHQAAIANLFTANDRVYDVDALFELTRQLT